MQARSSSSHELKQLRVSPEIEWSNTNSSNRMIISHQSQSHRHDQEVAHQG
jgi:hypothetical protein